jgi:hypothetical protein
MSNRYTGTPRGRERTVHHVHWKGRAPSLPEKGICEEFVDLILGLIYLGIFVAALLFGFETLGLGTTLLVLFAGMILKGVYDKNKKT